MKHLVIFLSLMVAVAGTPMIALSETYTCEEGPCIIEAKILKGTNVQLKWSGQGESYDFYRLTSTPHGGGDGSEYILRGHKKGGGTIDLYEPIEWELRLEGCLGDRHEPEDATCTPSSEKVRLDLGRDPTPANE